LRSLQEIQLNFVEEAMTYAGLWIHGKKEERCYFPETTRFLFHLNY